MAREKGTFNFSANLEVKKQGPLDARQTMITYAELTQAATWQDESGKMYLFNGLIVPVTNGSEKQLYMLIDAAQYNQTASWKRIDAGAAESGIKFINLISLVPFSFSHEDILEVIGLTPNKLKEEIQKSPIWGVCKDIENGNFFGSPISYINLEEDVIVDHRLDISIEKGEYFSVSMYDYGTKSIKSALIKFNKETDQYEKFAFTSDNSARILDMTDIAKEKYISEYSHIQVAPAKVFNRALFLGDLHALRLNAEVSELYQVFKNLLDNEEDYYVDFETLVLEVSEKHNNFLGKNNATGESTVIYSVINSSKESYSMYNPVRVSVCKRGNVGEKDAPLISFCYELDGKIYTLGFSLNGGYIEKTETLLSDVYRLPGDILKLTSESEPAAIRGVYGNLAFFKSAIIAKKVFIGGFDAFPYYVGATLLNDSTIFVSAIIGELHVTHTIIISDSDYVSIDVEKKTVATLDKVVQTVAATANKGIEIGGTATKPTVGLKLDTVTPGNVDLAVGANGLKATLSSKAVKAGNKVLKVETDKSISATVSLGYNSETKKLQLKGIDEEVFNELDATPFIKDGMLDSATLEVNPGGQSAGTYIKLVFNTESGKDPIYINVTSLIDVYTQGNGISISGKTIAVKLDTAGNSEGYLKLTAAGLKVEGVNAAIAAAIAEAFSWHDA